MDGVADQVGGSPLGPLGMFAETRAAMSVNILVPFN